ncbi:hypothetical protein BGZ65_010420, partial [Modicella reniformis]
INSPQVRSTDPTTEKTVISPSNNEVQSAVPKRSSGDSEYHQRSHSAAMGPMGANENHGPVRGRAAQQSPPRGADNSRGERADYSVNGNHDLHHARDNDGDMDVGDDEEHDEDEDMEGQDNASNADSEEENVDELMDEADFEEAEGSESMDSSTFYSRIPYGNRSLPSNTPHLRSGANDADGHEQEDVDINRHSAKSSWDSHESKDLPRQGAPRNNRPLQARPSTTLEAGGVTSAEYTSSSAAHINGISSSGNAEAHNGKSPDPASAMIATSASSVSVNNGSSKKRTTPAKHKCPQCDKYFTRPFNLKSHQRTHTQERPFVCSFTHWHMRTHWRIKPYSCPDCHRNFVRQDALTRHLRLDFGHNRCSGHPGPVPTGASNQEKTEEDYAKEESSSEGPSHLHSVSAKSEGS